MNETLQSIHQEIPTNEFIFTRKISFSERGNII